MALHSCTTRSPSDFLPVQPRWILLHDAESSRTASAASWSTGTRYSNGAAEVQVPGAISPISPFYCLMCALSSVHTLMRFFPRWCTDGLVDAREIWAVTAGEEPSLLSFSFHNSVCYFIGSVDTNPWKICNYGLVFLRVADVNILYLDRSLTAMKGESRHGSD
jgi:hypothetical protein